MQMLYGYSHSKELFLPKIN